MTDAQVLFASSPVTCSNSRRAASISFFPASQLSKVASSSCETRVRVSCVSSTPSRTRSGPVEAEKTDGERSAYQYKSQKRCTDLLHSRSGWTTQVLQPCLTTCVWRLHQHTHKTHTAWSWLQGALQPFYISHLSDRDGREGKERKHSPGQAQPPTDIFSHVGLFSERNSCTQSTRCSHGLTGKNTERERERGVGRWEGVVKSRPCTTQLHSSLCQRQEVGSSAVAASLIDTLQHEWEGKHERAVKQEERASAVAACAGKKETWIRVCGMENAGGRQLEQNRGKRENAKGVCAWERGEGVCVAAMHRLFLPCAAVGDKQTQ